MWPEVSRRPTDKTSKVLTPSGKTAASSPNNFSRGGFPPRDRINDVGYEIIGPSLSTPAHPSPSIAQASRGAAINGPGQRGSKSANGAARSDIGPCCPRVSCSGRNERQSHPDCPFLPSSVRSTRVKTFSKSNASNQTETREDRCPRNRARRHVTNP